MVDDIHIEPFDREDQQTVTDLIRRNMEAFGDKDSVLVATFRRISSLISVYGNEGCQLFVARDCKSQQLVGCAGLGPLHGLPISEKVGEIRDLVVEPDFRGLGIGSRLLHRCVKEARGIGYQRLYLETTPSMEHARKLFLRTGFRPVTESTAFSKEMNTDLPCYFLLENLSNLSQ